jgi:hypothetical protein
VPGVTETQKNNNVPLFSTLSVFQRYPPDSSWFEAAAGIRQEAEDRIREAGRFLAESKAGK